MAVCIFQSGNALLLLRDLLLPMLEQHSYLKSGISRFQQVLQVVILSSSPKPLEKTYFCHQFPLILAQSDLFCPLSMKWNETLIA